MIAPTRKQQDNRERLRESFPGKATIASLTRSEISQMSCEELVRVIRGARNRIAVTDAGSFPQTLDKQDLKQEILLQVKSGGLSRFVFLTSNK